MNRRRKFFAAIAASSVLLALAACASNQDSADSSATSSPGETPSAMDLTYHGEAVKARARALRTLDGVNAERKELQKEEQSFDRPAAPTPRENP